MTALSGECKNKMISWYNMLILIGPVIVGNRVHNFHTNWVMATRWCCSRGQGISISRFDCMLEKPFSLIPRTNNQCKSTLYFSTLGHDKSPKFLFCNCMFVNFIALVRNTVFVSSLNFSHEYWPSILNGNYFFVLGSTLALK